MKYLKATIQLNKEGVEPVIARLIEIGFSNVCVEDPRDIEDLKRKKNSYDWDYIDKDVIKHSNDQPKIIIYLENIDKNSDEIVSIKNMIKELKNDLESGVYGKNACFGPLDLDILVVDDLNWKDKWKEYFKPTKVSRSIVVKPTWEEYAPKEGEKVIEIDPGMAFGTGTHETTSLCIKMLEKYIEKEDKVLDVGCGSGILSIASGLLGASDVLAVDIDPTAVKVAKENISLNKQESVARACAGNLADGLDYEADVVVANLMADLVIMLSRDVSNHLTEDGVFISSGILDEKEEIVKKAIEDCGFNIIEVAKDDIWVAIVAKKNKNER